jgi:hypothetical protein
VTLKDGAKSPEKVSVLNLSRLRLKIFDFSADKKRRRREMSSHRSSLLVAIGNGLLVGVTYPFVDLGLTCRVPVTDACVWGKAFLPLTLGASILLLGGMVTALLYGFLVWKGRS